MRFRHGIQYVLSVQATLVLKKLQNQNKYDSIYVVSPETEKGRKSLSTSSVFIYRRSNSSSNSLCRKTQRANPALLSLTQKFPFAFSGRKICVFALRICILCSPCGSKFLMNLQGQKATEPNSTKPNRTETKRVKGPGMAFRTEWESGTHLIFKTHSANIDTPVNCLKCAISNVNRRQIVN